MTLADLTRKIFPKEDLNNILKRYNDWRILRAIKHGEMAIKRDHEAKATYCILIANRLYMGRGEPDKFIEEKKAKLLNSYLEKFAKYL